MFSSHLWILPHSNAISTYLLVSRNSLARSLPYLMPARIGLCLLYLPCFVSPKAKYKAKISAPKSTMLPNTNTVLCKSLIIFFNLSVRVKHIQYIKPKPRYCGYAKQHPHYNIKSCRKPNIPSPNATSKKTCAILTAT